ncbi:Pr6Pr family membrane protein [Actinokineospora soli]
MQRLWFAITAAVALAGLAVQSYVSATTPGVFATPAGRIFNMLCYFTIQSNVIVFATHALLAADPTRSGPVFRAFRLAGLIGITVTGVVYHTILRSLYDLTGLAHVADLLLHTATPILTVVGWLLFGPRGLAQPRTAFYALLFPALYLVFTLIRGPIVDFYPYPFLDVALHGYGAVLLNSLGVAALFLFLAFGAVALDRLLSPKPAAEGSHP